jgi:hypothetical protein
VTRLGRDARRVLERGDVALRDQLRRRARLEDLGDVRLLVNRRRERALAAESEGLELRRVPLNGMQIDLNVKMRP